MSREIKFRAWDTNNKEWFVNPFTLRQLLVAQAGESWLVGLEWMQYTGLKDKNGKEIYAGDIIEYKDKGSITDSGTYEIGWCGDNAGFGMRGIKTRFDMAGMRDIPMSPADEFTAYVTGDVLPLSKVIGTIYENPELISKP